jgi:hypothetical protein
LTIVVLVVSALCLTGAVIVGNRSRLVPTRWARPGEYESLTLSIVVFALVFAIDPSIVAVVLLGCILGVALANADQVEGEEAPAPVLAIHAGMNAGWFTLVAAMASLARGLLS